MTIPIATGRIVKPARLSAISSTGISSWLLVAPALASPAPTQSGIVKSVIAVAVAVSVIESAVSAFPR